MSVDYVAYYANQAGRGNTDYYRGSFTQAGSGLRQRGYRNPRMGGGGILGDIWSGVKGVYNWVKPYAVQAYEWLVPSAKEAGSKMADIGLDTLNGVAKDYIKGKPLAESVNNAIPTAINELKRVGAQTVSTAVDRIQKARDLGASIPDLANVNVNTQGNGLRQRGKSLHRKRKRKNNFILFKHKKSKSHKKPHDIFGDF